MFLAVYPIWLFNKKKNRSKRINKLYNNDNNVIVFQWAIESLKNNAVISAQVFIY